MITSIFVDMVPIGHEPTRDVEAVLDQIEQALGRLRSLEDRDGSWHDRG
jgi:hypothetical protein